MTEQIMETPKKERCRKCEYMFLEGSFHNCKAQARKDINEL